MSEKLTYTETGTHVYVRHAETGALWECPVDYLPIAKQRGWEPCERPVPDYSHLFDPAATAAGGPTGEPTGFDPAEHTVEEINDYLAEHLDSPGEIERVLALEAAGKNRTTVTDPRPELDSDS